jgi:hypothetical protein
MISAWLVINLREYSRSVSKLHLFLGFQGVELPSDERVIEGVNLGSNERSSPVSEEAEILQILHAMWREVMQPILWILEVRNL